ncbi:hypothetical protein SAMN05216464_11881 [Mucilaginibacter pineti]|uniref:Uncharacterized protein n=1 Tax=Mucilaginibacter pineti TaxID=1391627 RepID=A0A1G7LAB5_9SPHI|nr:hypothetical protein SAMN05216464_11881 [Mucilaginibacter pineti]
MFKISVGTPNKNIARIFAILSRKIGEFRPYADLIKILSDKS